MGAERERAWLQSQHRHVLECRGSCRWYIRFHSGGMGVRKALDVESTKMGRLVSADEEPCGQMHRMDQEMYTVQYMEYDHEQTR